MALLIDSWLELAVGKGKSGQLAAQFHDKLCHTKVFCDLLIDVVSHQQVKRQLVYAHEPANIDHGVGLGETTSKKIVFRFLHRTPS